MSGDSKPTDGPVSRFLNRRIASAIASAIIALNLPLTPNMLSLISFLTAAAAALFIAGGQLLVGGLLVQLSSVLDGVDGIVARRLRAASKAGGFLDTMLDRYADTVIYLALAYAAVATHGLETWAVLTAVLAVSGDIMVSYLHTRGERDAGVHPSLVGPLDSLASRDVRLLIVAVITAAGRPLEAMAAVALLSHAYVAVKSIYLFSLLKSKGV
ncbi:putative CDP-alcohol phosphatidyltransferase [Aeropyrum pernix K1]|uniref:CDP-alcohol phosphatidyltransferase n=1 Tax=Aeropyrum pernix (strain ATCC 700893 / DSM 11879 / JCM 9820 / NBRC 100138 / K1) TaxID=272557 RepID=Q9YBT3_AERPE|nr:CDP-alcohol phosphatidyltransferase family protein [Aeropyrum pernix]BAA80515.2 putative CDP-alcohol phosphatidyltransferase [Aeropyrum pernix K1]